MTEGRITDLRRFYSLLSALQESLGGPRRLATCTGQMSWSNRGVYFFMELGENRSDSGSGHELSASAPMRSTKAPERDSGRGCRSIGDQRIPEREITDVRSFACSLARHLWLTVVTIVRPGG
jgi:hypothetical protein